MSKIFIKKNSDGDNGNIFWVTMSDLMLGLAIIFITMFVFAMTGFNQNTLLHQKQQIEVSETIEQEFKNANIDIHIDKMTGKLQIPAAALFDINSYILTPAGKKLLDNIMPVYINTIFKNSEISENIESIAISGYSDSQTFSGAISKDEQFLKNMELSLKRAQSVAQYALKTNYNKAYSQQLQKKIIVEGNSSNNPIYTNGKEDFAKSRRVEIKLNIKNWDITSVLGMKE